MAAGGGGICGASEGGAGGGGECGRQPQVVKSAVMEHAEQSALVEHVRALDEPSGMHWSVPASGAEPNDAMLCRPYVDG